MQPQGPVGQPRGPPPGMVTKNNYQNYLYQVKHF